MQILSFDSVAGFSDHVVRLSLWRGPEGDFFTGQSAADRPAGYAPVNLTGCRLDMKVFENATILASLSTHSSPPQITLAPGVRGRFFVKFTAEKFLGVATGIYDQVAQCTFRDGSRAALWAGPITLLGAPS